MCGKHVTRGNIYHCDSAYIDASKKKAGAATLLNYSASHGSLLIVRTPKMSGKTIN